MFSKKDDSLLCPFDKKACIKERCIGWQIGPLERTVDGVKQTTLEGNCFIIWDLLIKKAIANRADGTQVAVESFRNEMVQGSQLMHRLMAGGSKLISG